MNFIENIKMKYKFLLVIFLPFLVLLAFITNLIYRDIQKISELEHRQSTGIVANQLGRLTDALRREGEYSRAVLVDYDEFMPQLTEIRAITDNEIKEFKNTIETLYKQGDKEITDPITIKIDQLKGIYDIRSNIDSRSLSPEKVKNYYSNQFNSFLSALLTIAQETKNDQILRNIYSLIDILRLKIELSEERWIIYNALIAKTVTQETKNDVKEIQRLQQIYATAFTEMETQNFGPLLKTIMSSVTFTTPQKYINQFLKSPVDNVVLDILPNEFWALEKTKFDALRNFVSKEIFQPTLQQNNLILEDSKQNLTRMILIIVGVLLLTLFLIVLILRSLTKKLQNEVKILTKSGKEIVSSINDASNGTTETATALNETTTTMEELRHTAQVSSDKAKSVSEVTEKALDLLSTSEKSVEENINGMRRIHEEMNNISSGIIKLSEMGKSIGQIIDTVNDLAEQSHLLAVNAAIEAAKAGDHGKGFAVVAQEVKSLAEQSKQSTIQVKNILNDIQNATSTAVMATEQGSKAVSHGMSQSLHTNDTIRLISQGINNLVQASSQIALSSEQQFIGIKQVTIAMANIKDVSNQQVEQLKRIEGEISKFNNVGDNLNKLIVEYNI